jgi:hypothetical protein
MKRGALVPGVKQVLESSALLLENKDPSKTRENFKKIHDDCAAIVKSILTSATAQPSPSPLPSVSASPAKS